MACQRDKAHTGTILSIIHTTMALSTKVQPCAIDWFCAVLKGSGRCFRDKITSGSHCGGDSHTPVVHVVYPCTAIRAVVKGVPNCVDHQARLVNLQGNKACAQGQHSGRQHGCRRQGITDENSSYVMVRMS